MSRQQKKVLTHWLQVCYDRIDSSLSPQLGAMVGFHLESECPRLISGLQRPPARSGGCSLSALLFLPVYPREMVKRFTVLAALYQQAFMADPDTQVAALVGFILDICPLLSPDSYVLRLVVFAILLFTESAWLHGAGGDDDVSMGIVS